MSDLSVMLKKIWGKGQSYSSNVAYAMDEL
jgi:hypothetical protein